MQSCCCGIGGGQQQHFLHVSTGRALQRIKSQMKKSLNLYDVLTGKSKTQDLRFFSVNQYNFSSNQAFFSYQPRAKPYRYISFRYKKNIFRIPRQRSSNYVNTYRIIHTLFFVWISMIFSFHTDFFAWLRQGFLIGPNQIQGFLNGSNI